MINTNIIDLMKSGLLTFFLVVFFATVTNAATYYVRTDGSNSNNGLTNSAGGAWRTIDFAADNISAGDVVRVQAGTYEERVSPGVDGSSVTNTVTFVADGIVTVCGFDLSSNNYMRIIGFSIDTDAGGCSENNACVNVSGVNTYIEFWNNTFQDANYNGIRGTGQSLSNSLQNSIIIGNIFRNFGIGNGSGIAINTPVNHCLIAYNEVSNSHPDAFYMFAQNTRWINNYTHDLSEASGGHSDIFQTGSNVVGWENLLVEGTFQDGVGNAGDEHTAIIQHNQSCGGPCGLFQHVVFRFNVFHNISSAIHGEAYASTGSIDNVYIYNNTHAEAQEAYSTNAAGHYMYSGTLTNFFILNNIEYETWGSSLTSGIEVYYITASPRMINYNLSFDPDQNVSFTGSWTGQSNAQTNSDPDFTNYNTDDFTISNTGGAYNNGGALTITNGSGTGTTFNVASNGGGFFRGDDSNISQYGGNLVIGDKITVGTDNVTISSISTDAITVTSSFTWANGESVYYGWDTTPDIGAYPYNAGGYTYTATYSKNSGTVTVMPSDASLVRMVVVFEDGIPKGVDSIEPYSIAGIGSGILNVRVYPLYPSSQLFVNATEGSGTPPTRTIGVDIVNDEN